MIKQKYLVILGLLFSLLPFLLCSQSENAPVPRLESPYNTIYVHLYYLQPDSYQPDIAGLTIPLQDSLKAEEYAIKLKQILDGKGLYVHLNLLPNQSDFIDSVTQKAYYTPFPGKMPEIYLERIYEKWYYSRETTRMIPELHKKVYPFGTDILVNALSKRGQSQFLGLALWQYIAILCFLISFWILHQILRRLLLPLINQLAKSRFSSEHLDADVILKITKIISTLVLFQILKIFVPVLQLPVVATEFTIVALNIILTILVIVLALRILDLVMLYALRYAQGTEHKLDEQLIPILRRMLSILFVLGGAIQVLRLLEVNVTALIAGISIGGLALALAAQDTVKNLIGSAMIFIDRPFQIGDYIEGSGFAGTVTEVGFRTTRVKTADTSILSVPNGNVANMSITNKGVRVFRLFQFNIGVTYDTPPALIETFTEELKKIINNHPNTRKEDYLVYLNEMAGSSLNILFKTFLEVPDYATELATKEAILMDILQSAERLGVSFAFPSTSVYVEQLPENNPKSN